MKTLNYYIISLITIGMMVMGCKDSFLHMDPQSNANANNFYQTKEDFELAINAAYSTLYTIYAPEGPVSYAGEMMGDNATLYIIAGAQSDKDAFRNYVVQPNNTMVYAFWQQFYNSLYHINLVLSKIEGADLDEEYKTEVRAQMTFLRGLYYFNMVRMWGDMPLVTNPITVEESYQILRSPVEEVYQQIINDVSYSAEHLPPANEVTVRGRASKGAAQMMLGEIYLTRGDKAMATTWLQMVYDSNLYGLLGEYASLWGPNVKNTQESIFEIQYLSGNVSNNTYSKYYQGYFPNVNLLGFSGVGMNQITDDLYNEFEADDPRRDLTISLGYYNGSTFLEQKYCKKWTDTEAPINGTTVLGNNNFMVYRYADLLLLLAEATGDPQYLNQVRTRAHLPLWGTPDYPKDRYPTLDLAVEHERRMELAIEFHRWFDLKRTDRAIPVLGAKGKPVTQSKLVLPIPTQVRDQNSAILQNEGY